MRRRQCLLVLFVAVVAAWMNVSGLVGRSEDTSARERSIAENLDQFKASGLRAIIFFVTTTSGRAEYRSQFIPDKTWGEWDPVAVVTAAFPTASPPVSQHLETAARRPAARMPTATRDAARKRRRMPAFKARV